MIANAWMDMNFYGDLLGIYAKDGTAKDLSKHTSRFFIKLQKNICVLCNHGTTRF
jgi:hypothetical protein